MQGKYEEQGKEHRAQGSIETGSFGLAKLPCLARQVQGALAAIVAVVVVSVAVVVVGCTFLCLLLLLLSGFAFCMRQLAAHSLKVPQLPQIRRRLQSAGSLDLSLLRLPERFL